MPQFTFDLRQAVRSVVHMRGVALAAVATLGIGIAATTSIASLAYSVMFRPVPFPEPDSLVTVAVVRQTARSGAQQMRWPFPKFVALSRSSRSFDALATFTRAAQVGIARDNNPAEQLTAEIVSSRYFDVLKTRPAAGRAFEARDDEPGHPVMIASASLWTRLLGNTPFNDGATVRLNGQLLTIIGVMPEDFTGLGGRADAWLPVGMAPALSYREYLTTPQHFISVVGRLLPNVSLEQANAELAVLGPTLPIVGPLPAEATQWSARARSISEARVDPVEARSAGLLLAAVGGVLLVTCLNVTTLLLMHARRRTREFAVRIALGARRGRIIGQCLSETALIVGAAAVLGLVASAWAIGVLRSLWGDTGAVHTGYVQMGTFSAPAFDTMTFLWALGLSVVCTLVTALLPALQSSRGDAALVLAGSSRSATRSPKSLRWLAGAEIAFAVLLLAGTFVLITTFAKLRETRVGFDPTNVVTFWVTPPASKYTPDTGPSILARMLEKIERVPGVTSAALNRCTPFGASCARTVLLRPDHPAPQGAPVVGRHYVSARYFETLKIPVLAGRALKDDDREGRPLVTVINETAWHRFWPGQNPIGQHLWFGSGTGFTDPARPVEVVGVVGDVKYWPVDEPPGPDFYTSFRQFAFPDSVFIVRSANDPSALIPALRRAIADEDADIPLWDARPLDDVVDTALSRSRNDASVVAIFALTAAALAGFGIFAVMAFTVVARRRELAIRLALGSTPAALRRLIVREATAIAIAGGLAGVAGAVFGLKMLAGFVYGIDPRDPRTLASAVVAMMAIAVGAALLPAMRAGRTSPLDGLKEE